MSELPVERDVTKVLANFNRESDPLAIPNQTPVTKSRAVKQTRLAENS